MQRDYISELGAVDSPVKVIANVFGFSLFGIFIMIFALGIYRQRGLNSLRKISAIFIFLSGISMFLVGIFTCDAGCENFSLIGDWHIKTSDTFIFPILAAGYIILAASLIKNKKLIWIIVPIVILGLLTLYLSYADINLIKDYPGIMQRIKIGLPFLLMMIISFGLYRFNKMEIS